MDPDTIVKVLDSLAKYAFAFLLSSAFVLFVPNDLSDFMGISSIRSQYRGPLFLVLIFSGTLWVTSLMNSIRQWTVGTIRQRRANRLNQDRRTEADFQKIQRLQSLNEHEAGWIACCLYFGVQTMNARMTTPEAQSLRSKGILRQGTGSVCALPFHIDDEVWKYLLVHRSQFLPDEIAQDPRAEQRFQTYRQHLADVI